MYPSSLQKGPTIKGCKKSEGYSDWPSPNDRRCQISNQCWWLLKFPQSSMDGMQIHCWRLCMPQDYERCLVHWAMRKQGKGLFWTSGWVPYPGTWEGWLLPRLFAIISKLLKCENTCFLFGTYHHILPILVRVVIDNRQVVVIKLWKWFLHDISETVIWKIQASESTKTQHKWALNFSSLLASFLRCALVDCWPSLSSV